MSAAWFFDEERGMWCMIFWHIDGSSNFGWHETESDCVTTAKEMMDYWDSREQERFG